MARLVTDGGYIMYPLLIIAVAVVALIAVAVRRMAAASGGEGPDATIEVGIDAVLFWGAFGVVVGLIGTLIGVIQAAQAVALAGATNAALVWGGIRVALIPTIFALLIFGLASLGWFLLRSVYRRRRRTVVERAGAVESRA
ncbi:MAG: MotA/TolQ/ExbB proton channel family protein [Gemmatimonadota bacterium]